VTEARSNEVALSNAADRATHEARHDPLTGLPNRKYLAERFEDLSRPDAGSRVGASLLMIDLDRFKDVNDALGHHCGDQLLVQVSRRLRRAVRAGDTAVRLGGDEFAILMPGVSGVEHAMVLAARVRTVFEEPFEVEGIDLDVEASVGVAMMEADFATTLRHADVAMYVAKRQGLGVFGYDPSEDHNSPQRLALLSELRAAIKHHDLVLHFQPKLRLATNEVVGVEALVRWCHPVRGLIPPNDFVPLAERTGLIRPLTRYVLDAAIAQQRTWIDAGRPVPIAVNLSARNLTEKGLVGYVVRALRRYDVPPALLELEITESSVMTAPSRARQLVTEFRELGIRVAIDDFGTGFTSLAALKDLPVSELKVDRSFVMGMAEHDRDAHIVRTVVQLSHALGITAVAEGVEDPVVLSALSALGCDVVQGYHFSRPLAAEDFSAWHSQWCRDAD
jgi:diguanylate cyclase (GGDEF)-like protein